MPSLVFNGFKFDKKDPHHAIVLHSIQTDLRKHLPNLIPTFEQRLQDVLREKYSNLKRNSHSGGICRTQH